MFDKFNVITWPKLFLLLHTFFQFTKEHTHSTATQLNERWREDERTGEYVRSMCEISVRVWADETTVAAMLCLLINYGRFTVIGVIRQRMLKMERRGKNVNEFRHWRNMATSFSCGGCFCFSFAFFSLYLFLLLLLLHLNRSLIGYFTLTEHKHSNAQMESVYYSLATIVFAKDCVRARSLFLFPSAPPPPRLFKRLKRHTLFEEFFVWLFRKWRRAPFSLYGRPVIWLNVES